MTNYALVGDVGGTNARLALCDLPVVKSRRLRPIQGLITQPQSGRWYLEEHKVEVKDGCTAIACPITGDWVAMTNHTWAFSIAEMKKNLGFSHLEILNDFTAVSMAMPMLKKEHLIQCGGAEPVEGKPIAVYGAGTGLGVAHLVHVDQRLGKLARRRRSRLILRRIVKKRPLSSKYCVQKLVMFRQSACFLAQDW